MRLRPLNWLPEKGRREVTADEKTKTKRKQAIGSENDEMATCPPKIGAREAWGGNTSSERDDRLDHAGVPWLR